MGQHPDHLVDGTGATWRRASAGPDGRTYRPAHLYPGRTHAPSCTRAELEDQYPPVRTVGPPDPATTDRFRTTVRRLIAFQAVRPRLVGTVATAVYAAACQAGRTYPMVAPSPRTSGEDAIAVMVSHVGPVVCAEPRRFDATARDDLTEILLEWVTDPGHYTCPAVNLALLLASPVAVAGGWLHVTDPELRASPQAGLLRWYVGSRIEAACSGST